MPVSRQKVEEPSEIGAAPPLNGHRLGRNVRVYEKHHLLSAFNRKNGTSFEISREKQRTEMLNRKYFDNLRQQQALSGRIDEPRATTKEQNGSTASFETDAATFDSTKFKLSPSKTLKENPRNNEETATNDTTSSSVHINGRCSTTTATTESRNGYDVHIKTEPGSGGSTPVCLQSPPPVLGGTGSTGSKVPPSSLPFTSSSSSSTSGRFGRSFSTPEAKRKRRSSRSSPLFGGGGEEMEEEDDLKLKPYVFLNNVIKTPPIKPLEEGDDPPITPSPTSVGPIRRSSSNPPTNNSSTSNHSNPPSTPTALRPPICGGNDMNSNSASSSQMAEDLNEFYRVMEQVCEKESRLSSGNTSAIATSTGATSTQIDMYSSMSPSGMVGVGIRGGRPSQHVISPPPYNVASSMLPQTTRPGPRYGSSQQLLTSPTTLTTSPPFSTAGGGHSLYNTSALVGMQRAPSPTLSLHQPKAPPYPSTGSMTSSQFSDATQPPALSQPPTTCTLQQPTARQPQQPVRGGGKPLEHQRIQPLSHLNQPQQGEIVSHQGAVPAPVGTVSTSHMYYNGSQATQRPQRGIYTSATPLPPPPPPQQTPQTPTTPLEHYTATFPTSQSSPTHRSNSLHHQTPLPPSGYTYSLETSHFLSNHAQSAPYYQSAQQRHLMQQQTPSTALTISTNSWAVGHRQAPQLGYKDNNAMMVAQHTPAMLGSGTRLSSLPQVPSIGQANVNIPPHLRMGHAPPPSLQHHSAAQAPPPAYLQSCGGSNSHGNMASFSRLSFPSNMQ